MKKAWNTPNLYDLSLDKTQGNPLTHKGHDGVYVDVTFTFNGQEYTSSLELNAFS